MKIQVEVNVPADMIVYDVGQDLIRCNRCCQTARTELSDNSVVFMSKFLKQHVASCITRQPPPVPRPIIDQSSRYSDDAWRRAIRSASIAWTVALAESLRLAEVDPGDVGESH